MSIPENMPLGVYIRRSRSQAPEPASPPPAETPECPLTVRTPADTLPSTPKARVSKAPRQQAQSGRKRSGEVMKNTLSKKPRREEDGKGKGGPKVVWVSCRPGGGRTAPEVAGVTPSPACRVPPRSQGFTRVPKSPPTPTHLVPGGTKVRGELSSLAPNVQARLQQKATSAASNDLFQLLVSESETLPAVAPRPRPSEPPPARTQRRTAESGSLPKQPEPPTLRQGRAAVPPVEPQSEAVPESRPPPSQPASLPPKSATAQPQAKPQPSAAAEAVEAPLRVTPYHSPLGKFATRRRHVTRALISAASEVLNEAPKEPPSQPSAPPPPTPAPAARTVGKGKTAAALSDSPESLENAQKIPPPNPAKSQGPGVRQHAPGGTRDAGGEGKRHGEGLDMGTAEGYTQGDASEGGRVGKVLRVVNKAPPKALKVFTRKHKAGSREAQGGRPKGGEPPLKLRRSRGDPAGGAKRVAKPSQLEVSGERGEEGGSPGMGVGPDFGTCTATFVDLVRAPKAVTGVAFKNGCTLLAFHEQASSELPGS